MTISIRSIGAWGDNEESVMALTDGEEQQVTLLEETGLISLNL